jgi:hypothetical protein
LKICSKYSRHLHQTFDGRNLTAFASQNELLDVCILKDFSISNFAFNKFQIRFIFIKNDCKDSLLKVKIYCKQKNLIFRANQIKEANVRNFYIFETA